MSATSARRGWAWCPSREHCGISRLNRESGMHLNEVKDRVCGRIDAARERIIEQGETVSAEGSQ